jgi:hypothetical protein
MHAKVGALRARWWKQSCEKVMVTGVAEISDGLDVKKIVEVTASANSAAVV